MHHRKFLHIYQRFYVLSSSRQNQHVTSFFTKNYISSPVIYYYNALNFENQSKNYNLSQQDIEKHNNILLPYHYQK